MTYSPDDGKYIKMNANNLPGTSFAELPANYYYAADKSAEELSRILNAEKISIYVGYLGTTIVGVDGIPYATQIVVDQPLAD